MGSLIMACADAHKVPAGGALAVDRDGFAAAVTAALDAHPLITIDREEIAGLPPADWDNVIVATGPLTSPALAEAIGKLTGEDELAFFDAIAPIVHATPSTWTRPGSSRATTRRDRAATGADYINCPLDRDQYDAFVNALLAGEKTEFKDFESTPYFDGCLPIEVMAERGRETLRHGPMKPVGLTNPHNPTVKACAIVQLRQDNALGTLYNMVGFQTKLNYGAQLKVFRTIPGLETAEFARLGGLHRNTFLNSPQAARCAPAAQGASHACASPARSPAARAMSKAPRRPDRRTHGRRRIARARAAAAAAHHRARRAAQPHHRRPYRDHRHWTELVSSR